MIWCEVCECFGVNVGHVDVEVIVDDGKIRPCEKPLLEDLLRKQSIEHDSRKAYPQIPCKSVAVKTYVFEF